MSVGIDWLHLAMEFLTANVSNKAINIKHEHAHLQSSGSTAGCESMPIIILNFVLAC